MDDQPNRALYYVGMLASFFVLAFLLAFTVFQEKKVAGQFSTTQEKSVEPKERETLASEIPIPDTLQRVEEQSEPVVEDSFDFEETPKEAKEVVAASFEEVLQLRADSIRSSLATGKRRTDVIIRYYPHLPDEKIVESLSDLGFYLHQRPTEVNQLEEATNSLFYGDNVPLRDIQLVAYELIKRGAKIRQIKMSRFHDDWKANSIEIGADASAEKLSVLSLEDIQNFSKAN